MHDEVIYIRKHKIMNLSFSRFVETYYLSQVIIFEITVDVCYASSHNGMYTYLTRPLVLQ